MGKIERFEDIDAWKKTRAVVNTVREAATPESFHRDFGLLNQLHRATYSIMLNIAEGYGRDSDAEFRQYLVQSRGSAREAQSMLYIALDANYISEEVFSRIYDDLEEICRMLSGLIGYLDPS